MDITNHHWINQEHMRGAKFHCAYCDSEVGSNAGFSSRDVNGAPDYRVSVYLCPNCNQPTYHNGDDQVPPPSHGRNVQGLPIEVERLYAEARKSVSAGAYTGTALLCRKLLMNIAASHGADAGKTFQFYVDYLEANHFTPPKARDWLDHIRSKGNEATHEIPAITALDARELIEFSQALLIFLYEFQERMRGK